MFMSELSTATSIRWELMRLPKRLTILWRKEEGGKDIISLPLCESENSISQLMSATRSNSVTMLLSSVCTDFRNFLRAGILKKRFFTLKLLPDGAATGSCSSSLEPPMTMRVPSSSWARRVTSSTWATATMEARASPRKPIVVSANRSSAVEIFDVACLSKERRASVSDIPFPLSMT